MFGYILIISAVIAFWCLAIYCGEQGYGIGEGLFYFFAAIGSFALLVITIWLFTKPIDAKDLRRDRDYYQECVTNLTDSMSYSTVDRILTKAQYINDRIVNNREHIDSDFSGIFFNRGIAETELIKIPELRYKNFSQD